MPKWIPEGWHSVTPRLVVHDPPRLVQFLRQAFGATGDLRTEMPSVMKIRPHDHTGDGSAGPGAVG